MAELLVLTVSAGVFGAFAVWAVLAYERRRFERARTIRRLRSVMRERTDDAR